MALFVDANAYVVLDNIIGGNAYQIILAVC